jgi:hypothetical protein
MKPYLRLPAVGVIALVVAWRLLAAPPADDLAGRLLLLDNQRVMEGDVARVGDQYRVRRDGGETLLPADRVLAVCPDLNAAYKLLRDRIEPRDAAARLRLAQWCDANGMRSEAMAEAQAVVELLPRSTEAQTLLKMYRQKAAAPVPAPVAAQKPAIPAATPPNADPIDCSAEALKRFTAKVQPVLLNTCVNCHAADDAGQFRLTRIHSNGRNATSAMSQNIAAALAQVDRAKPLASPLLLLASTAHGGATAPPLRDRGMPAFKQLEEWVKMVVDETTPPSVSIPPATVQTAADAAPMKRGAETDPKSQFGVTNAVPRNEPNDPFDPAIFNQQYHPNGTKLTPTSPVPSVPKSS